ncbi:serine/threonine-protein kinase [Nocardia alni]|uniref:serine/threonine-protein kinase n=1 Tax=Nocardia alni TaxID=2815723 RepID=UPI001C24081C|nr:serine/threonine-protein kinase [Nocardia alni]
MAMSPGTIVGGYRIERVLGAGGMGTVYLGKHPSLPRMDAIKVLGSELSNNAEYRARFEREANLAAGLDHPNIVSVYNRGEEDGQLWIAMQYVQGTDASAELGRDPRAMTPPRALRICTEVGRGLDYAHRRGLLHRDVKPANFLLSAKDGEDDERVLLTDFGVAKSTEDPGELTQTGSFVATIAYASPEQLQGMPVDHHADIYSLGCSLYKLLTGQNPYPATQPAMVMMGHLYEPPPQPSATNAALPPAIDQIFARVLAKNPADRYHSCREFTDAAAGVLVPGYNPMPSGTSPSYPVQTYSPGPDPRTSMTGATRAPASDPRLTMAGAQGNTGMPPSRPRDVDLSALMTSPKSPRRWVIPAAAGVVVVAIAAGVGIWLSSGGSSTGSTSASGTTTAAAVSATSAAQAKAQNPAFAGKTITMVDVTNDGKVAIYLGGTPQTNFLQSLGFVYNLNYVEQGTETSPRPMQDYDTINAADDSYILAVRSDSGAGGGGLLGLPYEITNSRATVIALDDPSAVSAMRTWGTNSAQVELSKLVPVLRNRIQ